MEVNEAHSALHPMTPPLKPGPPKPPSPDYVLRLRTLPGEVPHHIRMRKLLKYALRACGFRLEEMTEVRK